MKIYRDNWWNRIFHQKKLVQQEEKREELKKRLRTVAFFLSSIEIAKNLTELLELHKQLWRSGIRTSFIGPSPHGMFRTKDINDMKPEEVFLGNIFGLFTLNIPKWEESKEQPYGANGFGIDPETPLYTFPMNQYRETLLSALRQSEREITLEQKKLKI